MKVEEFDFDLPEELIAQQPVEPRDESRLMVVDRQKDEIKEEVFKNIIDYFEPGDLLVRNNTKVIPARLFGNKEKTGGKVEFLLLNRVKLDTWETLVKANGKVKVGTRIVFGEGKLIAEVKDKTDFGGRIVEFEHDGIFEEILDELGSMPLPPYIKEELDNPEKYQTVYAKNRGAAAAPTAGLHFTDRLLQQIKDKGVKIADVTLHVGLGTFRPVKVDDVEEHDMHSEYYEVSQETAQLINQTKKKGKRVFAVGTTTTRTLETVVSEDGQIEAKKGWTDIFIYPGYNFKAIDALITNFHLPQSTLIMMVAALAGKSRILTAYQRAIEEEYRFYSLGDGMLII
ncbi:S-adenosylmethionine:tRNA ribosyltransferase-isomerase [Halobacteroides halobius DSM 5150]|uniref:S-adenosylmethionine:tRNA ribosyltransferase-isomerase n=1 Tax=Halobacteroides halobius (strain ATCC 35273 / DSM 5150 / MD-1) TaxID=748449 RepID=L0K9T1_HALHC|nr:tRNA preQ1(34) S-adenosylmethionine ribosyltransferase-isomerase QueA [Halobacteroides halobius]AGB41771.1 S-adenosylmethionine:tRNA ribosyltransferase-isomerase [Halobacteroides halobius DSM 5150]